MNGEIVSGPVIVFGGTFDPVHAGHLSIAGQVSRVTGAESVWFVPSGTPSLHERPVAAAEDRLAMLRAAVDRHPAFEVRDNEVRRRGTSYTLDTMRELHRGHPGVAFRVLLGADAARTIQSWNRARELLSSERFVIVNRAGVAELGEEEATALGFAPQRTLLLHVDSPRVSAGEVRRRVAGGESLDGLVSPEVQRVIRERGLYSAGPSQA